MEAGSFTGGLALYIIIGIRKAAKTPATLKGKTATIEKSSKESASLIYIQRGAK